MLMGVESMQHEKLLTVRFSNGAEFPVPLAIRRIQTGKGQRGTNNPHYSNVTHLTNSSRYLSEQYIGTHTSLEPMNGEAGQLSSPP